MSKGIYVTKTFLPPVEEYIALVRDIFKTGWITNFGKYHDLLQSNLKEFLSVENLVLTSSGTTALQVTYKTLNIKGKVITTPFSFIATLSSMVWEGIQPLFADIDPNTLCLDPSSVEYILKREKNISAIVPVHVYGIPCDIEAFSVLSKKYNVKIIYDAAHCFGILYKDQSILKFGDASILSFHATKIFHTIEGGAIIFNHDKGKELTEKAKRLINFGIETYYTIRDPGINGKMNEFEAAMGLLNINYFSLVVEKRRRIWERYYNELKDIVVMPKYNPYATKNYAYFPIILRNEKQVEKIINELALHNIFPRRYFYPSLSSMPFISNKNKPVSLENAERISRTVLCLPLSHDLKSDDQTLIIEVVKTIVEKEQ